MKEKKAAGVAEASANLSSEEEGGLENITASVPDQDSTNKTADWILNQVGGNICYIITLVFTIVFIEYSF